MVFCAFCGTASNLDGASYCSKCGRQLDRKDVASPSPFSEARTDFGFGEEARIPRSQPWTLRGINARLNAVGLWLNSRASRIFHKPMTKERGRAWFIVATIIIVFLLIGELAIRNSMGTFLGVQTGRLVQIPFLLISLGILFYLIGVPRNWRLALQALMWVAVGRGIIYFIWNLVNLPSAISQVPSVINLFLIFVFFILLAPLVGFLLLAPATYVWIRTRRPSDALSE